MIITSLFIQFTSFGQVSPPDDSLIRVQDFIPSEEFEDVPTKNQQSNFNTTDRISIKTPLTSWESYLSLLVLAFSFLVLLLEIIIVFKLKMAPKLAIQFISLTLVILSTIFLITAGYGKEQIAPAMGLLGTIVGYLLARNND